MIGSTFLDRLFHPILNLIINRRIWDATIPNNLILINHKKLMTIIRWNYLKDFLETDYQPFWNKIQIILVDLHLEWKEPILMIDKIRRIDLLQFLRNTKRNPD